MTHALSLPSAVVALDRVPSGEAGDDHSRDEPLSGQRMRRAETDEVNMVAARR